MVIVSSTFSAPVDGILLQTAATKLFVNDQELGIATLYITENNVVWCGGVTASGTAAPNISLVYPSISLHAVQREPSPALYMVVNYELRIPQLQQHAGGDADAENDEEDDDFDADEEPITQLRFIPQNENDLQAMFSAMSQGQSLHPDPQDEVDEDDPYMDGEDYYDGDEEEFEDAEETGGPTDEAAARLRQMRLEQVNGNHAQEDSEDAEISED